MRKGKSGLLTNQSVQQHECHRVIVWGEARAERTKTMAMGPLAPGRSHSRCLSFLAMKDGREDSTETPRHIKKAGERS